MGRYSIIIIGLLASFNSCHEANDPNVAVGPIADFDYSATLACGSPVQEFQFNNRSQFANKFFWDFGDGTTSTLSDPRKVYQKAGSYKVRLTASSAEKHIATTKSVSVTRNIDGIVPVVGLTYMRLSNTSLTYSFTMNASGATRCSLDFGDGGVPFIYQSVTNSQTITHTYSGPGHYAATLTAFNDEGQDCAEALININP